MENTFLFIGGAAMKKLLQIAYGVLKSEMAFDPNYALSTQSNAYNQHGICFAKRRSQ